MSYLTALLGMYCEPGDIPSYTEEELAAMKKAQEEREERMKHTFLTYKHFEDFARLESFHGASGVKILLAQDGVLHIMNTQAFQFHYHYCVTFLNEKRTLEDFNEQVYTGKDRSMMFATIVAYPKGMFDKLYCLELNPADPMVPGLDKIDEFFALVKKEFMVEEKDPILYFHPTSASQIEAVRNKQLSIPVIQSSEIFGDLAFKTIQPGPVCGKELRIFENKNYTMEELQDWLNMRTKDEVVVIPTVPNDIPAVGGVFCNEIIPPLCHVALLCQNRNTPCCFYKDATEKMKKFNGRVMYGTVGNIGFALDHRSHCAKFKSEEVRPISLPDADTMTTQFIDLGSNLATDARIVGAKAAQLAKVEAIYSQPIFKGTFTVPFHYYNKHVIANQSLYRDHVYPLLVDLRSTRSTDPKKNVTRLSTLMETIVSGPVDAELVQHVIDKIIQNKWRSVILRSSTNAEDLVGFNGAGLYESIPLMGADATNPEKIGHALKTVWASVWSPKAVKERQYYSMDDLKVQMAVLVQPYISEKLSDVKVLMNGVCITHDVSRHKVKHGFVINVLPGSEYKVTNHYKDITPESVTLLLNRQKGSVDLLLNSMCNKCTGPLLTQFDAVKMVEVFGNLHNTMLDLQHSMNNKIALDIEFMFVDNTATNTSRELVVLQARPYKVNAPPDGVDYDKEVDFRYCISDLYFKYKSASITCSYN